MKTCCRCKKEKILKDFGLYKVSPDGHRAFCNECRNFHRRNRYANDAKYKQARIGQNNKSNRKRKADIKQYQKEWYQRPESKERTRELQRLWYANNPVKAKKRGREKYKKRMSNPVYRINNAIHAGLSASIKHTKAGRKWQTLVGYTLGELINHLVSQFDEGMSLENYGKWHIDHKIPCSFFVFDSPQDVEFRMCWRLENLQPLWAEENIRKSNKIIQAA